MLCHLFKIDVQGLSSEACWLGIIYPYFGTIAASQNESWEKSQPVLCKELGLQYFVKFLIPRELVSWED